MTNKITKEEHDKLSKELERIKTQDRVQVAKDLKEAISQGDLSENAAYSEAKDRQAAIEGRMREIEQKLGNSEVIEEDQESDTIGVGSVFTVVDEGSGDEREFSIVGPEVSSPAEGKVSFDSPLGGSFLGHKKGDIVEVVTPAGKKKFEILDIQ